jgi:7-carboxy-7-deazaguanine synthase
MAVQGEQPYDCADCGISGEERLVNKDKMNYIFCDPNHPNESFWLNRCGPCHYYNSEMRRAIMQVYSIFTSINGEVSNAHQGSICTFIRLAGCHVGCTYCDTAYAADPDSGKEMGIQDIVQEVMQLGPSNVTITGGEPLEQFHSVRMLALELLKRGFNVSIETSGEIPFDAESFANYQYEKLSFVVDIKIGEPSADPRSKYHSMNLNSKDFLKIVIGDEKDIIWAVAIKQALQDAGCKAKFAFSAMDGVLPHKDLLRMMMNYGQMDAILNIQIHKMLSLQEDK